MFICFVGTHAAYDQIDYHNLVIRKMLRIISIRTEQDLTEALARIDEIIDAAPGTPEYEELTILGDLVYAYENKHHSLKQSV